MRVLIAPDKFKGSLTSAELSQAIQNGVNSCDPSADVEVVHMADGGDGTLDIIKAHMSAFKISGSYLDALSRKRKSHYLISGNTAYISLADTCGIAQLKESEKSVYHSSTRGMGQQIADAVARDCKTIYLLVGGSASHDLGTGMAEALGYRFLDNDQQEIGGSGANLHKIQSIRGPKNLEKLDQIDFVVLTDVQNPLYGPDGAAVVYGPQKARTTESLELLESWTVEFANRFFTKDCNDIPYLPGSGAAGGIAAGAVYFLNARLQSGSEYIAKLQNLDDHITEANLVITGEGKLDRQSLDGKVLSSILAKAEKHQKELWIVCAKSELASKEVSDTIPVKILESGSLARNMLDSMENADIYVKEVVRRQMTLL